MASSLISTSFSSDRLESLRGFWEGIIDFLFNETPVEIKELYFIYPSQIVVLENFESPLDSTKFKPINPKGNPIEYSLKGLMLKLKLCTLAT